MSPDRTCALVVVAFFLRTTFGGHGDGNHSKKNKQCNWWCAACGGQYVWRAPNRLLAIQDSVFDPRESKVPSAQKYKQTNKCNFPGGNYELDNNYN